MTTTPEKPFPSTKTAKRREWSPHFWVGCDFFAWLRLLLRHDFAVHWSCWYVAVVATVVSLCHTVLRLFQESWYGDRLQRTRIRNAPLFIIGHWRTGTTFLHELLILDPRHSYPTTYECLEPNHFLLTESLFTRTLRFLVPSHRPMDNMAAGWDRPQEDEFALCMMGQSSPYLTIAFPNHPPEGLETLDMDQMSPRELAGWKRAFYGFLQRLTFKHPKRLVLKSPPHSCRIKVLLELFPDARFVHIVRNPYVVFPSTVKLWKSLYLKHGLQKPTYAGLEDYVFDTFNHLYRKIDQGRALVDPRRFYELHYEDLVVDPVGWLKALYEHLELGGFEAVQPRLEQYLASIAGYETNRFDLSLALRDEITRRWGHVIRQYGYAEEAARPTAAAPNPTATPAMAR